MGRVFAIGFVLFGGGVHLLYCFARLPCGSLAPAAAFFVMGDVVIGFLGILLVLAHSAKVLCKALHIDDPPQAIDVEKVP